MQTHIKSTLVFLVIAFLIVGGITLLANRKKTNEPAATGNDSYTLADVKDHGSATDCWSIVGSNVYDLTSWINKHPGGKKAILSICGKDGTEAFHTQHDGEPRPEQILATYQVGTYKP
jgi:cytochrome b involved in lipid metabolism